MIYFYRQRDSAFTLIELLLVITILAILSSLSLVVIAGAQTDARKAATQSRISQIHAILAQRFEEFEVRRIPLRLFDYSNVDRSAAQELKRRIVVEYINTEMPRNLGDIARDASNNILFPTQSLADLLQASINMGDLIYNPDDTRNILIDLQNRPPALATRFYRPNNLYPETISPQDPDEARITTSSEYLYLILQMTDYDGTPAIEFLGDSAIGDTDNDGFLEIVDAFGNPMEFTILMYDDNGVLMRDPPVTGPPMDLDSAYTDANGWYPTAARGVNVRNLKYRIISRFKGGDENGGETISN